MISLLVSLALAVVLGGCTAGSASSSGEMAERFYRYGQYIGSAIGKQDGTDEEVGMIVGLYMLSDNSPEGSLLMVAAMLSTDKDIERLKKKLIEGVRNPKDTSSELFLDPLPEADKKALGDFVRKYAGKNFAHPDARRHIFANLESSTFPVRAVYAKHLIARYADGQEHQSLMLSEMKRQSTLESSEREKQFWTLLKEVVAKTMRLLELHQE